MADDSESESEQSDDAYAQADALLEEMRRFNKEASSSISSIDKSEAHSAAAAAQMHERLNKTAMSIIQDVVSGAEPGSPEKPSPVGDESEPSENVEKPNAIGESEREQNWSPRLSSTSSVTAAPSRSRFTPRDPKSEEGVASAVSDISRLASKPLIPGEPMLGSSRVGGLAPLAGRGGGRGRPRPRQF